MYPALYKCGLNEDVACKVAQQLPLDKYDNLPRMLAIYVGDFYGNQPRFLQSSTCCSSLSTHCRLTTIGIGAEFHEMLAELGFRPEVIAMATYADEVLPHGLAQSWVERLAGSMSRFP